MLPFTDKNQSKQIPRPIYNQHRSNLASLCDKVMSQVDSSWNDLYHSFCGHAKPQLSPSWQNRYFSLYDSAWSHTDPNWRDRYYATDIDKVLAIFAELHKKPRLTLETAHHKTLIDSTYSASPSPAKSSHGYISTSSSATTRTPSTLHDFSNSSTNSSNTPATLNMTPPDSTVEHPFDQSSRSGSSISCEICGQSFKGKVRDQKSNLLRHIRTVHRRSTKVCPECSTTLTRSDNLRKHQRAFHGYS